MKVTKLSLILGVLLVIFWVLIAIIVCHAQVIAYPNSGMGTDESTHRILAKLTKNAVMHDLPLYEKSNYELSEHFKDLDTAIKFMQKNKGYLFPHCIDGSFIVAYNSKEN